VLGGVGFLGFVDAGLSCSRPYVNTSGLGIGRYD
jgi:hypothetical protein